MQTARKVKTREICDIRAFNFMNCGSTCDSTDVTAQISDRKMAARRFETIHNILRSLSLAESLLKGRNAPICVPVTEGLNNQVISFYIVVIFVFLVHSSMLSGSCPMSIFGQHYENKKKTFPLGANKSVVDNHRRRKGQQALLDAKFRFSHPVAFPARISHPLQHLQKCFSVSHVGLGSRSWLASKEFRLSVGTLFALSKFDGRSELVGFRNLLSQPHPSQSKLK